MRVRELEDGDIRDAVRILVLSFSRELNGIFGDIELARELFFKFFSLQRKECLVAESDRIVGFASYSFRQRLPISGFLRRELGFVRGVKASLLIRYLCPKPRKGKAVINFIAVSPLRRNCGAGSLLLERIIESVREGGGKEIECLVSVDNDEGIGLLSKFGFEIARMLDNSFAEKNFGIKQWYLMRLVL
uniref:N-acetyltransferase n=1 Tax=Archaeoglobus fulgidus TaxID=2234 RepID=A0A7C3MA70_ARCFL